jgi:hypothetical protein
MASMAEIRDAAAGAALEIARELGVALKFHQPGAVVWADLYGFVTDNGRGGDEETLSVIVPRQTGFPPASGIGTGSALRYNDIDYSVDSAVPDIGDYQSAATFSLDCHRYGVSGAGDCDIGEVPA